MRNGWAVCKREFASFFITPVGFVIVGTYAVISGVVFWAMFYYYHLYSISPSTYGFNGVPDFEETFLSPFLVYCGSIIAFIGPLVTMRLLAEEKSRGTIELLLTHPLRDRDIIFGKYAAALGVLMVMMSIVVVYMLIVFYFVPIEPSVLVFGVFSILLMGAAFLSLGLFVSSICRNQVTAGAISFGAFFTFYLIGLVSEELPETSPVPEGWPGGVRALLDGLYHAVLVFAQELPLDAHAQEMALGIVQPHDIAYYLLFSAFFLFLTFRVFESPKWRT